MLPVHGSAGDEHERRRGRHARAAVPGPALQNGLTPACLIRTGAKYSPLDFEDMRDFIARRMKMTHIYQPLMIKTLLESNNEATAEDVARGFLNEDKAQLEYYTLIAKRWPSITLRRHNVVSYNREAGKGVFRLLLDGATRAQKARLVELCEARINEYVDRTLRLPWYNRRGSREHIPGKLRYDVLAKSGGICVACGASARQRALEVDHIVPVNRGGTSDISNLQALCYRCNAQKKDRDKTDFIMVLNRLKYRNPKCSMCMSVGHVIDNHMAFAVRDDKPVTDLHSLVLPRRHVGNFFDLIPAEKTLCLDLVDSVKTQIQESDGTVTGFNVKFDAGRTAGPMTEHCQIHVIPQRRTGRD